MGGVPDAIEELLRLDARTRGEFEAIYMASFPPSERVPTAHLFASVGAGGRRLLAARRAGTVVGFALMKKLVTGVAYLEYFAIDASARGQGLGGQILEAAVERLRDGGRVDGLLLEVEAPGSGPPEGQELRRRRIGFYSRHGGELVECAPEYRVPDVTGGDPLPMLLIWISVVARVGPPSGELLRECVDALMRGEYGLRAADPLLEGNLARLTC